MWNGARLWVSVDVSARFIINSIVVAKAAGRVIPPPRFLDGANGGEYTETELQGGGIVGDDYGNAEVLVS